MQTLNDSVAAEVRAEMARQRLTIRTFAGQLGWSYQMLFRRINGEVDFTTNDLEQIARALAVPLSTLISPPARTA